MAKRKSLAFMNYGRWLYPCLDCGAILPADKDICPICYPDATAILFKEVKPGLYRPVPDAEKRQLAHSQAEAANRLYEPELPAERQKIERVLRDRDRQHMNWEPGESLDLLIADNIQNGIPLPPELNHAL